MNGQGRLARLLAPQILRPAAAIAMFAVFVVFVVIGDMDGRIGQIHT